MIISVSAIVPVYNNVETLERAVMSLVSQDLRPIEIFIVNNNSTDGSLEVALRLQTTYPGLIQVLEETNQGAPYARNAGAAKATGDWLQFLDADDTLRPFKIKHQAELVRNDTETGLVIASGAVHYQHQITGEERIRPYDIRDEFYSGLIISRMGFTPGLLIRKDWFERIGGWNTAWTSCQEYVLMLTLVSAGCPYRIDYEIGSDFYTTGVSISRPDHPVKKQPLIVNKLKFNRLIREKLIEAGKFNEQYDRELKFSDADLIFQNGLKFGHLFPDFFKQLKAEYHSELAFKDKFYIYKHYVYGVHVRKKGWKKYPQYAFKFLKHLPKLFSR